MLYFKTRSLARAFAASIGRKVKDLGADKAKRWAVFVLLGGDLVDVVELVFAAGAQLDRVL